MSPEEGLDDLEHRDIPWNAKEPILPAAQGETTYRVVCYGIVTHLIYKLAENC